MNNFWKNFNFKRKVNVNIMKHYKNADDDVLTSIVNEELLKSLKEEELFNE